MNGDSRPPGTPATRQWRSRPGLSRAVRMGVVALPTAAGLVVCVLLERLLPRPAGMVATLAWWLLTTAGSLATLTAGVRLGRRLLPLAALLDLSLVFPDRAPRRFAVARSAWRVRDVQRRLDEARERGSVETDLGCAREMLGLVAALSVHDRRTRGHSERVRVFTDMLADELGLPEEARSRLRWASLLHDVGKIHVPPDVLNKPGRPTADEWEVLQRHPIDGARMIAPLMSWLGPWALAVEQHHERWDGTGYPRRLAGEEISLGGRVVAVADAFETMTAARPYKRALSVAAARQELVVCSGGQFDPAVVRAFLTLSLGRLWRVVGIGAWVSQVPTFATVLDGLGRAGVHVVARGATAATALGLMAGGAALAPPSSSQPAASAGDPRPVAARGPLSEPGIAGDGAGPIAPSPVGGGGGTRASSSPTPTGRATPLPGPTTPTPPTGLWTTAGHLGVSTGTLLPPGGGLGPLALPAVSALPALPALPSLPGVTGAVPTVLDGPRLPLSLPSLLGGQGR